MKKKQENIDREALLLAKSFEEHVLKFKAIHKMVNEAKIEKALDKEIDKRKKGDTKRGIWCDPTI